MARTCSDVCTTSVRIPGAEAVARGRQRFAQACGDCNGENGDGSGEFGAVNNPDFLALASDQMLRRIIITGRPDLGMPDFAGTDGQSDGFQALSSSEIDDLVALLGHWRTAVDGQSEHMARHSARERTTGKLLDRLTRRPPQ